ncbi:MAG: hypothetical protein IT371_07680 [Deltaproteobacteria bacterium]|nr:hypothetical protein [Deltaproteobacteria bacterium]
MAKKTEAKIDVDAALAGMAEKKAKVAETVAKRKAKLASLASLPAETQRVIQQLNIFAKQVGRKRGLNDLQRDRVLARVLEKGLSSCSLDDVYGSYKEIKAEIAALPKTSSRAKGAATVNRADILAFCKSERGSVALNATVRQVLKAAYCRTGKGGKEAAAKLAAEFDAVFSGATYEVL